MVPPVVVTAFVQRSCSENEDPALPTAAAVVETVVVLEPELNSATATSPFASRLASTRRVPSSRICTPCMPSASWSTATSPLLVRIARVAADAPRRSLPAINGAAIIAHIEKWVRISVSVMPPFPTSSMSGSLNRPGAAYAASVESTATMLRTPIGNELTWPVSQDVVMSSVVRHWLATSPQFRDGPVIAWKLFGLMLRTIGRPVLASASRILPNAATWSLMVPLDEHQSYLR